MDKSLSQQTADSSKNRETAQTSTDSPPPSPLSQNLELSPNDDDSITTSTESSDTFEAWTLVMDKQKLNEENRVEIVKDNDDHEDEESEKEQETTGEVQRAEQSKDNELQDSSNDVTTDDLSDGISIISESESNGRISPHPYLRDHLQDLNLKFSTTSQYDEDQILHKLINDTETESEPLLYPAPVIASEQQQLRHRAGRRSFDESQDHADAALQEASQAVVEHRNMPQLLKTGIQGIFYIGVVLAVLGLIGKIRNPTWKPLGDSNSPSTADLERRFNDMKLENNLMRAEIDILNRQIKHLHDLNDPRNPKNSGKYKRTYDETANSREGKTFKVWSGNGETLKPVEITKDDLRRPYKCPDGTYKEFAGMCLERNSQDPNIVEQFEQVVDDFKQQSETMQTFEQVAQELHGFTETPLEQIQKFLKGSGDQKHEQPAQATADANEVPNQPREYVNNKPIYEPENQKGSQQIPEYEPSSHDGEVYEKCRDKSDQKCYDRQFKPSYEGGKKGHKKSHEGHLNEKFEKFKYSKNEKPYKHDNRGERADSKENTNKQQRYDSKERYQKRNDDSKEEYRKRNDNDSKEKYYKLDEDSKERYSKRSRENSSKERFRKQKSQESGEWQEKYMKHRENVRKENEQKYYGDNKNWYIKRADGRENKRNNDDIRYR